MTDPTTLLDAYTADKVAESIAYALRHRSQGSFALAGTRSTDDRLATHAAYMVTARAGLDDAARLLQGIDKSTPMYVVLFEAIRAVTRAIIDTESDARIIRESSLRIAGMTYTASAS